MHVVNTSFYKTHEIWNFLETDKSLALSVGVIMVIMCPMIVLGNTMIIFVVWKDPLRSLRSFTSTYILQSLAVADCLVGSILCPTHSYWSLTTAVGNEPVFSVHVPLALNAIFTTVSVCHVLLLTIDRLMALLAPLQYRVKVTNRRVCTVICAIWGYALVLGVFHAALAGHFLIFNIIYTAQVLVAVSTIICMNIVILCHFLKDPARGENSMENVPIRHFYQREKNLTKAIALMVCANIVFHSMAVNRDITLFMHVVSPKPGVSYERARVFINFDVCNFVVESSSILVAIAKISKLTQALVFKKSLQGSSRRTTTYGGERV